MQAVMISIEGREDSAQATVAEFDRAGVEVEVFSQPEHWEVNQSSNNKNARRAIKWAIEHVDGPGFLFIEDDLIVKPERMKRALKAAQEVNEVVYMYMHDVAPRTKWYPKEPWIKAMIKEGQYRPSNLESALAKFDIEEGLRLMSKDAHMFGSQCVYIPKPYAKFLYAHMDQHIHYSGRIKSSNQQAVDTCLNNWRFENHLPTYVYLPHPVQHLQNRERRKRGTRGDAYSKSFDVTSTLEVNDGV